MATYITKSDASQTVGSATITIGRGYSYTCSASPMLPDTFSWSKHTYYIAPVDLTNQYVQTGRCKFDLDKKLFYFQTVIYGQQSQKIYEDANGQFEIIVKRTTTTQETVTPTVKASPYPSDWQTNLKCNSGKSYLNVDYPIGANWEIYINNVLYDRQPTMNPITGLPNDLTYWLRNWDFWCNVESSSGQGIGEYGIGSFSEAPVTTITSTDFDYNPSVWDGEKRGKVSGSQNGYAWGSMVCDGDTVTMSSNAGIIIGGMGTKYDSGGNGCYASWHIESRPSFMRELYYQYQVDATNLQGINVNQLQFQASELDANGNTITWTGLSSPTVRYTNQEYHLIASVSVSSSQSNMYWVPNTATPPFTTDNDGTGTWQLQETGTIPQEIGGVKCLNPQLINNYVQSNRNDNYGQGDIAGGTDDNIQNTIVKIEPTLNYTPTNLFTLQDNITVIDKRYWQTSYCSISNDTVTVTQQNWDDARANNTYPMIWQEFERDTYSMENYDPLKGDNIPPKEYRQRHWTKCRYVTNPISHPTHSVFPIRLICKAYGDLSYDYTWILGRDMLIESQGTEYFDQAMINNHQVDFVQKAKHVWNRLVTSSCDEYMSTVECEKLQVWDSSLDPLDPDYGALYYMEQPIHEAGYLPNIVGRAEIRLPVGSWELSDMKTKKVVNGTYLYAKDEFQQPTACGFRMPKEYDLESMDYDMNRYIVGCQDGLKGFEIPQTAVTHSAQYQVDWWQIFTYGQIKSGSIIYPRDDLGEITFASQTYTPDADGNLPIANITDNDENFVYWLKPTNNGSLDTRVRVDYIKGEELNRYIGYTQNHQIKLVTEYGGLIHGNSHTRQGEYVDSSPYHNSSRSGLSFSGDYYANENVGTQTQIDLRNFSTKTVENPNQCLTYSDYHDYIRWANNEIATRYNGTITDIESEIVWTEDEPPEKDKIAISVVFNISGQTIHFNHTFEIPTGLPSDFYTNDEALEGWALAQLVELYERYVYNNEIDGWTVLSDDGNVTVCKKYSLLDNNYIRTITKVIDGGKYWFSAILREYLGKIWRASFGIILRQDPDYFDDLQDAPSIMQGGQPQPQGQQNGNQNL